MFYWTSVSSSASKQHSFVLVHNQASGKKVPFFFAAYSKRDLDRWYAHILAVRKQGFYRPVETRRTYAGGLDAVAGVPARSGGGGGETALVGPRNPFTGGGGTAAGDGGHVEREDSNPFSRCVHRSTCPPL